MNFFEKKDKSLRERIRFSYFVIIAIMLSPTIYAIAVSFYHTAQYDNIITNVGNANRINLIAKNDIPNELWEIVSGRKTFGEGRQYLLLNDINHGIDEMNKLTKDRRNKQRLNVAYRTEETLSKNVSRLGLQIMNGSTVAENEILLDEIRSIVSLFSDVIQDFSVAEIELAYNTNVSIRRSSVILTIIQIFILVIAVYISSRNFSSLSKSIQSPIAEMESLSTKIAQGDLTARVKNPDVEELDGLASNLNIMAGKIDSLIKQNIEEQINLQKAEMKALQSQITPHFLYNTFDTIIWLAEENQMEDVVQVTRAFSEFLRISLSRGHEWITVKQEIDHVKNYLTIQKIRYADILDYEIEVDEELYEYQTLKLILQPLVENAIYHGIKNKRGRGHLKVSAHYTDESKKTMTFAVEDNGAGFKQQRLEEVREEIAKKAEDSEKLTSVYGLFNVNKRILLYYENKTEGLKIESEYRKGSRITFTVPCGILV